MLDNAKKKISSGSGETITEVLVAVLVITLGLTMLAAMIPSASHLSTQAHSYSEAYSEAENALEDGTAKPNPSSLKIEYQSVAGGVASATLPVNLFVSTSDEGAVFRRYAYKDK